MNTTAPAKDTPKGTTTRAGAVAARAAKPGGAACTQCPLRDAAVVPPATAIGQARLAVVGDAPAWGDASAGVAFGGGSGRLLARGLRTIGVAATQVHWTTAIACECPPVPVVMAQARKACADRLRAELAGVGAPVVVAAGSFATHSVVATPKRPQIQRWRGSVTPMVTDGRSWHAMPIMPLTLLSKAPKWKPVLELDVARIGRVLADGFTPPELLQGRRIVIARSLETLDRALQELKIGPVGFDVETVGLGPTETALVCFALSDGKLTVVVPWSKGRNGKDAWWGDSSQVAVMVTEALRRRVTVTHNGPAFDHIVMMRYGLQWGKWEDTLLATHAVASHMPKGLSHLVQCRLDVTPWKEQEDRTADIDRLHIYNARDTLYTILAWHDIKGELQQ